MPVTECLENEEEEKETITVTQNLNKSMESKRFKMYET
jgi:hypothetical protein